LFSIVKVLFFILIIDQASLICLSASYYSGLLFIAMRDNYFHAVEEKIKQSNLILICFDSQFINVIS